MMFNRFRRRILKGAIKGSILGIIGMLPVRSFSWAMGTKGIPQGMQAVEGTVTINGTRAKKGDRVAPGDTVATGAKSLAVFTCGESAFMMQENSRLVVDADGTADESRAGTASEIPRISKLKLLSGKLLSVFGRGGTTLETPQAYMGIQGTGVYCETGPQRTYICTCYGKVSIQAAADPAQKRDVETRHHESPFYVYAPGHETTNSGSLIERAPMKNHTDKQLIRLEGLVRRSPPFVENGTVRSHEKAY